MIGEEKLRIVVVDDSVDTTQMMTALLNGHGFEAKAASDATAALGLIHQWLPHCVLLDIDMPGIDGVELARHLRANYGQSVMLIALSGWNDPHPRVQRIKSIVDHYLAKPCAPERLIALLQPLRQPWHDAH